MKTLSDAIAARNWSLKAFERAEMESDPAKQMRDMTVVVSLVAQVSNTYFLERELDERIAIVRQTISTCEESYRIARRRYEVGYASQLDAVQAEITLQYVEQLLNMVAHFTSSGNHKIEIM